MHFCLQTFLYGSKNTWMTLYCAFEEYTLTMGQKWPVINFLQKPLLNNLLISYKSCFLSAQECFEEERAEVEDV